MWLCVLRIGCPPGVAGPVCRYADQRLLPKLTDEPGFRGGYVARRDDADGVTQLVFWSDERSARHGQALTQEHRQDLTSLFGAVELSVELHEIVARHD